MDTDRSCAERMKIDSDLDLLFHLFLLPAWRKYLPIVYRIEILQCKSLFRSANHQTHKTSLEPCNLKGPCRNPQRLTFCFKVFPQIADSYYEAAIK